MAKTNKLNSTKYTLCKISERGQRKNNYLIEYQKAQYRGEAIEAHESSDTFPLKPLIQLHDLMLRWP